MQLSLLSLGAIFAPVALADFHVFCGEWGNAIDGAGFGTVCKFLGHAPISCSDALGAVNHYTSGDVSDSRCGGVRCEGCSGDNARDWVITQLEINDSQRCTPSTRYWDLDGSDEEPHFTIYNDNGVVNIVGVDGQDFGSCSAVGDPQEVQCSDGLGNGFVVHNFDCQSPLSYRV